ncbi:MAG: hypothetical protein ACI8W1_002830, partial [Candidatus Azotimanducaceae bacterium]
EHDHVRAIAVSLEALKRLIRIFYRLLFCFNVLVRL